MIESIEISVPDGICGKWRVETFLVSEEESRMTLLRATVNKRMYEYVPAGSYKRLCNGWDVVMSNTPMEIRTNSEFITQAHGHILINGLGLGMVLSAILLKEKVKTVTVIEREKEVIELVGATFEHDLRVNIIHADAFTWQPDRECFDVVWHDIWNYITADNLPEMDLFMKKYANTVSWQGAWCYEECLERKNMKRQVRRHKEIDQGYS